MSCAVAVGRNSEGEKRMILFIHSFIRVAMGKLSVFWLALMVVSCGIGTENPMDSPVVSVGEEHLTVGELKKFIPANVDQEDSSAMADGYVNRWVTNKLFLRRAELNLTPEEQDVTHLLEEYRTSLLVHLYQQKMLEQKYSPLITSVEIESYYNQMIDNFKLKENILKGVFIKVSESAPNLAKLKEWCRRFKPENVVDLETYSFQNARLYDEFLDNWVPFQRINANLPSPIKNEARFLQYNRFYETAADGFQYYLVVTEFCTIGDVAPMSYVEERIKAILLNKKRGEFIKNLEKELYDEALQEKIINFY